MSAADEQRRQAELAALAEIREANGGILRGEDVLTVAANPDHILHPKFQWDDSVAGHQYRLWQAREMITVYVSVVVQAPEVNTVQVYVSLSTDQSNPGGGYRLREAVLVNPVHRLVLLTDAINELRRVQCKYNDLVELAAVFTAIDEVAGG